MRHRKGLTGLAVAGAVAVGGLFAPAADAAPAVERLKIDEFRLSPAKMDVLRERWANRILKRYPRGSWAPMRMDLTNADLKLMGLPSKKVLLSRRYAKPTMVRPPRGRKDRPQERPGHTVPDSMTVAGTGYFGIRPGGWLLLLGDGGVGWCSFAHVYGSPGRYKISTAGHCGKAGDIATMIGLVGNRTPVLLDVGKFSKSVDGGLGKDYALIDIFSQHQDLVTPTMAFWGGPKGVYTKTGSVATLFSGSGRLQPSVNPDPLLVQQILHYGHGIGIGAGGTPRSGTAVSWGASHFMFFGALAPGDSGSASNTLGGDSVGAVHEAAGINTHIYVDLLMRKGLGIMGGTRVTSLGTPANGELVGNPLPSPRLP